MHPNRMEIRRLLENVIADERKVAVLTAHLQECEFCSDIAEEERMIRQELERVANEDVSPEIQSLAKRLYQQSLRGALVKLSPLNPATSAQKFHLAADSPGAGTPRIENLLTLFSEKPEFVLNVMRDNSAQKDYLQLSSDEPANVSQVLVRIPPLDTELLTDTRGHVDLPQQLKTDASQFKWQVKLPSAVFDLEPMTYDPEKVEFSEDVELTTDNHDKIQVTFQRKTEGAQVIIRVLELDGQTDFKHVRVALSQVNVLSQVETATNCPVTFEITDKDSAINIRLFH